MHELPMFPLGSVLLPHMVLPLHVFEPRYRRLMEDLEIPGGEFGVTLITRGHEVGGDDQRADLGTVARILEAERLEDDRWLVIAVGTQRFRVDAWLADAPYPRARVERLPDPRPVADDAVARDRIAERLRQVLSLQSELEEPAAPASTELDPDPLRASYQASVLAPLGPLDRQTLLAAASAADRLALLETLLDEAAEVLRLRLGAGQG